VLITFLYILNAKLQNYKVQTSLFSKRLRKICLPNYFQARLYYAVFHALSSKLGHKLTNVKTARINKVVIAFVYRITLRKHLYSASVRARSVFLIVLKLNYIVQYFTLFLTTYSKLGHKLTNVHYI
jgi:hypothetical protein